MIRVWTIYQHANPKHDLNVSKRTLVNVRISPFICIIYIYNIYIYSIYIYIIYNIYIYSIYIYIYPMMSPLAAVKNPWVSCPLVLPGSWGLATALQRCRSWEAEILGRCGRTFYLGKIWKNGGFFEFQAAHMWIYMDLYIYITNLKCVIKLIKPPKMAEPTRMWI